MPTTTPTNLRHADATTATLTPAMSSAEADRRTGWDHGGLRFHDDAGAALSYVGGIGYCVSYDEDDDTWDAASGPEDLHHDDWAALDSDGSVSACPIGHLDRIDALDACAAAHDARVGRLSRVTTQYQAEHHGETSVHGTMEEARQWLDHVDGGAILGEWHPHIITIHEDGDSYPTDIEIQRVCGYYSASEAEIDDNAVAQSCIIQIRS